MFTWLLYTILGGISLGGAYYFRKLATKTASPIASFIVEGIIYGILVLVFFAFQKDKQAVFHNPLYASLAGVCLVLAGLLLYKAFPLGKLSQTTVIFFITGFILVLILSLFFLKEQLNLKQIIGLLLGLISIFLLKS